MEERHLYIVGFSKGGSHFSYKANLTHTEFLSVVILLAAKADSHEVVRDDFYLWEESGDGLKAAINELLG